MTLCPESHKHALITSNPVAQAAQSALVKYRRLPRLDKHLHQQRRHERDCLVTAITDVFTNLFPTHFTSHASARVLRLEEAFIASTDVQLRE